MNQAELERVIRGEVAERRLLVHPFYRRWEAGELAMSELAAYAGQYRHFEAALPLLLSKVVDELPESEARAYVVANLDDETGNADQPAHLELFADFCDAVGAAGADPPSASTEALLRTYEEAVSRGPGAALAALAAYEFQAPEIATSKAQGLRTRYGLDAKATKFWDLHGTLDVEHRTWMLGALSEVARGSKSAEVASDVRSAAEAWWGFLDEREDARPAPARS